MTFNVKSWFSTGIMVVLFIIFLKVIVNKYNFLSFLQTPVNMV